MVDLATYFSSNWADIEAAGRTYGTPLYLIDEYALRRQATQVVESFRRAQANALCLYSFKTNGLRAILRSLRELGFGADVSNLREMRCAVDLGIPPEQIVFNAPVKTMDELRLATDHGILIHLDGWDDLGRIASLNRRRRARVGVRVASGYQGSVACGRDIKFGFEAGQDAAEAIRTVARQPNLSFESVHFHLGTEVRSAKPYRDAIAMLSEAVDLAGYRPKYVDIGGGFTASGRIDDDGACDTTLRHVAAAIVAALDRHFPEATKLLVEPGRAAVAGSTTFLTRVAAVKRRAQSYVVILDGGVNLVPSLTYAKHPILFDGVDLNSLPGDNTIEVFGPLCMSIDRLATLRSSHTPKVGELVAVLGVGAYNYAESWTFGRGRPAVVCSQGAGQSRIVRSAEDPSILDHLERVAG